MIWYLDDYAVKKKTTTKQQSIEVRARRLGCLVYRMRVVKDEVLNICHFSLRSYWLDVL